MKSFSQFLKEEVNDDVPAQHLPRHEFKKTPGETHFHYDPEHFISAQRKNPKMKHWAVYNLGSSHHDPQAMYKIVSGHEVPKGVKQITSHKEHEAAWKHVQGKENSSFRLSRKD